jgi:hypothetical protein
MKNRNNIDDVPPGMGMLSVKGIFIMLLAYLIAVFAGNFVNKLAADVLVGAAGVSIAVIMVFLHPLWEKQHSIKSAPMSIVLFFGMSCIFLTVVPLEIVKWSAWAGMEGNGTSLYQHLSFIVFVFISSFGIMYALVYCLKAEGGGKTINELKLLYSKILCFSLAMLLLSALELVAGYHWGYGVTDYLLTLFSLALPQAVIFIASSVLALMLSWRWKKYMDAVD